VFDFVDRAPSGDQNPAMASQLMAAFSHFASSASQRLDSSPGDDCSPSLLWDGATSVEAQALVSAAELATEKGDGAHRVVWLPEYGAALLATEPAPSRRLFIVVLDTWRLEELRGGDG
jgi:hypothetical protein